MIGKNENSRINDFVVLSVSLYMRVSKTIREELQKRFPGGDFSPYFDFLESLPKRKKGDKHHILPRKEFPAFERHPENLIRVPYQDHFKAHYLLAVCAPDCGSFQNTIWFMTNYKARKIVSVDLPKLAEVYERGRDYQSKVVTERWDEKQRAKQSQIARRVNQAENAKLQDFKCGNCGTDFKQVVRSVYAGHRRFCLHHADKPVPERPFVTPTNVRMKMCGRCGKDKPLDEFNVERLARLGRANWCRICAHKHHKKPETKKLRDYECPACGMEFKQVKPGVFGGHRRSCLNYGPKRKEFLSWNGSVQEFAVKHDLPVQTVWRWRREYDLLD